MNKSGIERIVLALDPGGESRAAIRTGTELAAALKVPFHCVFVEDEGLIGLADLALARHFDLAGLGASQLDRELIEASFRVQARRIEADMRETAARLGVKSQLEIVRGALSLSSLDLKRGDLLVMEGGVRPIAGLARLESRWPASACAAEISVLVLRRGLGPRVVVGGPSGTELRISAVFGDLMTALSHRSMRLQPAPLGPDAASAGRWVEELDCDLVVLEEQSVSPDFIATILSEARCNVLILRE